VVPNIIVYQFVPLTLLNNILIQFGNVIYVSSTRFREEEGKKEDYINEFRVESSIIRKHTMISLQNIYKKVNAGLSNEMENAHCVDN